MNEFKSKVKRNIISFSRYICAFPIVGFFLIRLPMPLYIKERLTVFRLQGIKSRERQKINALRHGGQSRITVTRVKRIFLSRVKLNKRANLIASRYSDFELQAKRKVVKYILHTPVLLSIVSKILPVEYFERYLSRTVDRRERKSLFQSIELERPLGAELIDGIAIQCQSIRDSSFFQGLRGQKQVLALMGTGLSVEKVIAIIKEFPELEVIVLPKYFLSENGRLLDLFKQKLNSKIYFTDLYNYIDESNPILDRSFKSWLNVDDPSLLDFTEVKGDVIQACLYLFDDVYNSVYKEKLSFFSFAEQKGNVLLEFTETDCRCVHDPFKEIERIESVYLSGIKSLLNFVPNMANKYERNLIKDSKSYVDRILSPSLTELSCLSLLGLGSSAAEQGTVDNINYFCGDDESFILVFKRSPKIINSVGQSRANDMCVAYAEKSFKQARSISIPSVLGGETNMLLQQMTSGIYHLLFVFQVCKIIGALHNPRKIVLTSSRRPICMAAHLGVLAGSSEKQAESVEYHILDPMLGPRFYLNDLCDRHLYRSDRSADYAKSRSLSYSGCIDVFQNLINEEQSRVGSVPKNASLGEDYSGRYIGIALKAYSVRVLADYITNISEAMSLQTGDKYSGMRILLRFHPRQGWRDRQTLISLIPAHIVQRIDFHTGSTTDYFNRIKLVFVLRGTMISEANQNGVPCFVFRKVDYPFFATEGVRILDAPSQFSELREVL